MNRTRYSYTYISKTNGRPGIRLKKIKQTNDRVGIRLRRPFREQTLIKCLLHNQQDARVGRLYAWFTGIC